MAVANVLTLEEYGLKSKLKKLGVLKRFKNGELRGLSKNGGVAIVCGDGDIDVIDHHTKEVSNRRHCRSDFGGVLLLMQGYRGFSQTYAFGMTENIKFGFNAKQTRTIFAYFHYPCAAASYHKHTFIDVLHMIANSEETLMGYGFQRVYVFLHVRRMKKEGHEKQNTYLVDVEHLKKFIQEDGLGQ
jgi:hypothetical protein